MLKKKTPLCVLYKMESEKKLNGIRLHVIFNMFLIRFQLLQH